MFAQASIVRSLTSARNLKTSTGLKDNYLEHFIDKIGALISRLKGPASQNKQQQLDKLLKTFPKNVLSPIWRIKGIYYYFVISII